MIVASSREETSSPPPGSGASPQGLFSPVATVRTTFTEPFAGGVCSAAEPEGDCAAVLLGEGLPPAPDG
ncbi:hypothetical protein GCM10010385_59430 [Streptomyces geysiriensis]|nr:hypothetical protein GCM10010385_59430 [Streptomyces geysiriensis]